VGPDTPCAAMPTPAARVSPSSSSCFDGPLEVAKARYPTLAEQLGRYELQREERDIELTEGEEFTYFVNSGDCFAVLVEPQPGDASQAFLGFSLRVRGSTRPGERVAPAVKATGGRAGPVQLSPEFCPWDHQPLAIWNAMPKTTSGRVRIHLLRREHPEPARLAREQAQAAPPPPPATGGRPSWGGGGNCSSMECGEDCRSELGSCKLDCFRHGRRGPGGQSGCEAVCRQLERACHRGCAVPCSF
jgi:hypothetical protein